MRNEGRAAPSLPPPPPPAPTATTLYPLCHETHHPRRPGSRRSSGQRGPGARRPAAPALRPARAGRRARVLKPESLQPIGSFKDSRGYGNRLLALTEAERARGVLAYSSGNHAQGVGLRGAAAGPVGHHRDAHQCAAA
ncbi:MAG: pyridoxal-phosphate dependent enzyme [Hymenobacter sp.]